MQVEVVFHFIIWLFEKNMKHHYEVMQFQRNKAAVRCVSQSDVKIEII